MEWQIKRRAVLFGLALLLVGVFARTAWTARADAKANAQLQEAGRWLKGLVVVVDPGHGGGDPGAVVRGSREKEIVLQIATLTRQVLEQHGARVVLTRTDDESLGGTIRQDLGRRVALVEANKAHLYISIHANKDSCNCWGAQTFFQRNGMPQGKELAIAIQNRMRQLTPTTRVALPADYFVLRTSPVPATMVEVGFMSNAGELDRLKEPDYQRVLARAIALGIADWVRASVPEAQSKGSIGE